MLNGEIHSFIHQLCIRSWYIVEPMTGIGEIGKQDLCSYNFLHVYNCGFLHLWVILRFIHIINPESSIKTKQKQKQKTYREKRYQNLAGIFPKNPQIPSNRSLRNITIGRETEHSSC